MRFVPVSERFLVEPMGNGGLTNDSPRNLGGQRILITGGLGFIGSNLAHRCTELGARVTIYDFLDPRSGGNMQNVAGIEDQVEIIANDLRNFEGVSTAIRHKDIVFNCAAYTSHPHSMTDPLTDIEVNCKGTIHVLEAARRFNPEAKIVHVGTSTQIGRMVLPEASETHPEFPQDIYSANKSASEKYTLIYASAYNLRTTVVRLANNYGPRSNIRSADFGFVNYFIGLALKNRALTVFGDGSQLRNISFVADSVEALISAALDDASRGQVFFAVADEQITVAEIARAICEHIGGSVRFIDWPKDRAAIEIGDAVISNAKIKSVLGWTPTVSLQSGLRATKEYYASCLNRYL
jgi:UDP-glucose 4-epimerase